MLNPPMKAIFPKLQKPVVVAASDMFWVPAALDLEKGRAAIEHAVRDSVFRPFDIANTRIDDVRALWVPFWRISVSVDGFHISLSTMEVGSHGRSIPVPTGGARFRDADVMICGRTIVPYEPKLPSLFGRASGIPPLEIPVNEMVASPDPETLAENGAETVDADVDQARAEGIAMGMLLREVSPTHAIYAKYEPKIRAVGLCLYPLYYARYTYNGEARRHPGEELFIAVSGKTGQVVAARYPSAVRSVAAKVRRLLSFDNRR
jgi:hypothetical protein